VGGIPIVTAAADLQLATRFSVLACVTSPRVEKEISDALVPFGYKVVVVHDGRVALERVKGEPKPDLVISEVEVPTVGGFELALAIKRDPHLRIIPLVLVTSFYNLDHKLKGFHVGVDDFLYYPFHELELRARVSSLLRLKHFYTRLQSEKEHLDELVRKRTRELDRLNLGLISALEGANRLKDSNTGNHIRRVSEYSRVLAEAMGLDGFDAHRIQTYASLHDVGKIGLPDHILKKDGKLTPAEFEEMKKHTVHGYELLRDAGMEEVAQNIALHHHERWDGRGYPHGLRGREIPLEARVVALGDVYDALTTRRSYKEAMPHADAREHILELAGKHFDPHLVDAFALVEDRLVEVSRTFDDADTGRA
jgi:putative two-component system response regulator